MTTEDDTMHAWSMALSLEDASLERRAAVTAVLARLLEMDVDRIVAASGMCRDQAEAGGDSADVYQAAAGDSADVYQAAAGLLAAAAELAANPLPESDVVPDPTDEPSPHPTGVAALWRRLQSRRVRYQRSKFGGFQRIELRLNGRHVGKVMYAVCLECRLGLLGKISIDSARQRTGIGRRVIARVVAAHPDVVWHTTVQMPGSQHFWTQMAADTGHPFTFIPACMHLDPHHGRRLNGPDRDPASLDL